jgi:hypothetical protein
MVSTISRKTLGTVIVTILGIVTIIIVMVLLGHTLSLIMGPFNSSIIVAVIIAAIIVGVSWGIHLTLLRS